jgi:hypothetical protein
MQKMGGMSGLMGMMPGMGKIKKQLDGVDLDNSILKRQIAMISSMTKQERRNPKVMNASRKKRVAQGPGVEVQDINRLLKMHLQMSDMMKKMRKGKGGLLGKMMGMGGGAGMPSAEEMEKMQAELPAWTRARCRRNCARLPKARCRKCPRACPALAAWVAGCPAACLALAARVACRASAAAVSKACPASPRRRKICNSYPIQEFNEDLDLQE